MAAGAQYDYRTDPEFLRASAIDMSAYLKQVDPDFAKASPKDQADYISHLKGLDQVLLNTHPFHALCLPMLSTSRGDHR